MSATAPPPMEEGGPPPDDDYYSEDEISPSDDDGPPPPLPASDEDDDAAPPPLPLPDDDDAAPPPLPPEGDEESEGGPPPPESDADSYSGAPPPPGSYNSSQAGSYHSSQQGSNFDGEEEGGYESNGAGSGPPPSGSYHPSVDGEGSVVSGGPPPSDASYVSGSDAGSAPPPPESYHSDADGSRASGAPPPESYHSDADGSRSSGAPPPESYHSDADGSLASGAPPAESYHSDADGSRASGAAPAESYHSSVHGSTASGAPPAESYHSSLRGSAAAPAESYHSSKHGASEVSWAEDLAFNALGGGGSTRGSAAPEDTSVGPSASQAQGSGGGARSGAVPAELGPASVIRSHTSRSGTERPSELSSNASSASGSSVELDVDAALFLGTLDSAGPLLVTEVLKRVPALGGTPANVLRELAEVAHSGAMTVPAGVLLDDVCGAEEAETAAPKSGGSLCILLAGRAVSPSGSESLEAHDWFGEECIVGAGHLRLTRGWKTTTVTHVAVLPAAAYVDSCVAGSTALLGFAPANRPPTSYSSTADIGAVRADLVELDAYMRAYASLLVASGVRASDGESSAGDAASSVAPSSQEQMRARVAMGMLAARAPDLTGYDVLEGMVAAVKSMMDAEVATLFEADASRECLVVRVGRGTGILVPRSGLAGYVWETRESAVLVDAEADERYSSSIDQMSLGARMTSLVAVPVWDGGDSVDGNGQVCGVLVIGNRYTGDPFSESDATSATVAARAMGRVVAHMVGQRDLVNAQHVVPPAGAQPTWLAHRECQVNVIPLTTVTTKFMWRPVSVHLPATGVRRRALYVHACLYFGRRVIATDAKSASAPTHENVYTSAPGVAAGGIAAPGGAAAHWSQHEAAPASAADASAFGTRDWVALDVTLGRLPPGVRVAFGVHAEGSDEPLAWASASVFTVSRALRIGRLVLGLREGGWPAPAPPSLDDDTSGAGHGVLVVEIQNPSDGAVVVATDIEAPGDLENEGYHDRGWTSYVRSEVSAGGVATTTEATHIGNPDAKEGKAEVDGVVCGLYADAPQAHAEAERRRNIVRTGRAGGADEHETAVHDARRVFAAAGGGALCDAWTPRRLTKRQRAALWLLRTEMMDEPNVLPLVVRAAPWMSGNCSSELADLLRRWPRPSVGVALQLLDGTFASAPVRAYAVQRLARLPSSAIVQLAPQLSCALAWESDADSVLARFILRRALAAPKVAGVALFRALKVLTTVPGLSHRINTLLRMLIDHAGSSFPEAIGLEMQNTAAVARACLQGTLGATQGTTASGSDNLRDALAATLLPKDLTLPVPAGGEMIGTIAASLDAVSEAAVLPTLLPDSASTAASVAGGAGSELHSATPAGSVVEGSRRRASRLSFSAAAGKQGAPDADISVDGGVFESAVVLSQDAGLRVSRCLLSRPSGAEFVATVAAVNVIATEYAHAQVLSSMRGLWAAGRVGVEQSFPNYAYGACPWHERVDADSDESCIARVDAPGIHARASQNVAGSLLGLRRVAPQSKSLRSVLLADRLGLPAQGPDGDDAAIKNAPAEALQRWLVAAAYEEAAKFDRDGDGLPDGPEGKTASQIYTEIIGRLTASLAAHVVASYVLALGPRNAADILVTPQGELSFASIGFAGGVPERDFHSDADDDEVAPPPPARLASSPVLRALTHVVSRGASRSASAAAAAAEAERGGGLPQTPEVEDLVMQAVAAFDELRERCGALLPIASMLQPLGTAGLRTARDVELLRGRFMLGLERRDACAAFAKIVIQMMGLDAPRGTKPDRVSQSASAASPFRQPLSFS